MARWLSVPVLLLVSIASAAVLVERVKAYPPDVAGTVIEVSNGSCEILRISGRKNHRRTTRHSIPCWNVSYNWTHEGKSRNGFEEKMKRKYEIDDRIAIHVGPDENFGYPADRWTHQHYADREILLVMVSAGSFGGSLIVGILLLASRRKARGLRDAHP